MGRFGKKFNERVRQDVISRGCKIDVLLFFGGGSMISQSWIIDSAVRN